MIQRIQTVYLILVIGALATSLFSTLGFFINPDGIAFRFSPLGVEHPDGFRSTWGIFCILLLTVIIPLATIFLYKNRILQIRLSIFNSILIIGYYITFLAFFFVLRNDLQATFRINWALCLPLIALIFNYLAIRAIGKDEVMVKAADRLR